MKVLAKEILIPHKNGIPAFPGFVSYIHPDKPILIHRFGWEMESDNRDDWMDAWSYDNGRTWTEPVIVRKSTAVAGGRIKYMESAGYYDTDTRKFITFDSKSFYPNDQLDVDSGYRCQIIIYDANTGTWGKPVETDFGYKEGATISFSFPLKLRSGRILVPMCKTQIGPNGKPVHYKDCWAPVDQSLVAIGDYQPDGSVSWHASKPIAIDTAKSTRGLDENTLAELPDGRIAMVIRGSNDTVPDLPGYKWVCYSSDQGETWTEPQPWTYADGSPVESSATGSCLFRSFTDGKLYWMGNLCLDGTHANGNWPRSPLYLGQVQEQPFALKRDTLIVIDQRQPNESPGCQLSNFRYYQDRDNGDIVIFLTRFGERSETEWKRADYYRYRVSLK